jgi:hypothetical protein
MSGAGARGNAINRLLAPRKSPRTAWVVLVLFVVAGIAAAQHAKSGATANAAEAAHAPTHTAEAARAALNTAQVSSAIASAARLIQAQAPEPEAQASDDATVEEPTAESLLSKARSEPRDEAWADTTTRVVREDLGTKAEQLKFHVGEVECRTTTCFVKLDWPSLSAAHADFKATLGPPNRADCHVRLMLPEGANADAPAEGILFFDCSRQRARAALNAHTESPTGSAK